MCPDCHSTNPLISGMYSARPCTTCQSIVRRQMWLSLYRTPVLLEDEYLEDLFIDDLELDGEEHQVMHDEIYTFEDEGGFIHELCGGG